MDLLTIVNWQSLDAGAQKTALTRAPVVEDSDTAQVVERIVRQVREDGDNSLRALTRRFDGAQIDSFAVSTAQANVDDDLIQAMDEAIANLRIFHERTLPDAFEVETARGVRCGVEVRPIQSVGLYIPGGTAPLVSTAIMLALPAVLAGCPNIVAVSPPGPDGAINPGVLAALHKLGVNTVYRVGGAQAIAAMAFGTQSIPRVDKIFGPGNRFVTAAKQYVSQCTGGPAIDMPAGPSEVMVIADGDAKPVHVAADLLSQAEHGPDSQALLLTDSAELAESVRTATLEQVESLPRADVARQALQHSRIIVASTIALCADIANQYAAEHLIINTGSPRSVLAEIQSAGSVFLGPWSAEALGDYCSGTNHVLPTYAAARAYSGVSVESFCKRVSVQEVSREGLDAIGPAAQCLARAEGLEAHRRAVSLRMGRDL